MPTIPVEQYPSDATIESVNGQTDPGTGLDYIARGTNANSTPTYEFQYNRRLHRLNGVLAVLRQGMVVDEGNLNVGVYPIEYRLGAAQKAYDGATGQAVSDDATTYVWIDSANALQTGGAFPADPATYLPLAKVVAQAGQLAITDMRGLVMYQVG